MEKITQKELDEDQAYWCSRLMPEEFYEDEEVTSNPVESYRFVIFDLSKED